MEEGCRLAATWAQNPGSSAGSKTRLRRLQGWPTIDTDERYRRLGLGTAMLLHGMHLARAAGATHMTVTCLGAPGHPQARGLYYGVGFRQFTRDAPLIKPVL